MKVPFKISQALVFLIIVALSFTACKKSNDLGPTSTILKSKNTTAVAIVPTSAMATTALSNPNDSIYALKASDKKHIKTAVSQSSLLASISTYLKANYVGYSFVKAFSTTEINSKSIDAYVVGIMFNGKPVALKFDSLGNLKKVLELKEGKYLVNDTSKENDNGSENDEQDGANNINDGEYGHSDANEHKDSIALSALPKSIISYYATNYPQDTLKSAYVNKEDGGSYIIISKNIKLFSTEFNPSGSFIEREVLGNNENHYDDDVAKSKLPSNILTYLNTTYPNYIFKKAFSDVDNGVIKGYLVIIDANLTKYSIVFNGSGAFVSAKVIR